MPSRVCFLTAEISPFAKTGGLGDVAAALSRHLRSVATTSASSCRCMADRTCKAVDRGRSRTLQGLSVQVGTRSFDYDVHDARAARLGLLDPTRRLPCRFRPAAIYSDAHDEHVRYLMLTRAALDCCQRMGFAPRYRALQRLAHGIRAAAAAHRLCLGHADLRRIRAASSRSTTSVTRACSVRPVPRPTSDRASSIEHLHQADLGARPRQPDAPRHPATRDAVTTVSPTYAREIRTPEGGYGLDADLRARGDSV